MKDIRILCSIFDLFIRAANWFNKAVGVTEYDTPTALLFRTLVYEVRRKFLKMRVVILLFSISVKNRKLSIFRERMAGEHWEIKNIIQ